MSKFEINRIAIELITAILRFCSSSLAPMSKSELNQIYGQGQLQEWTEHSHTDLPKSETSRDIKKSFEHHLNIFKNCINF